MYVVPDGVLSCCGVGAAVENVVCVTHKCALMVQVYMLLAFLEWVTRSIKYFPFAFPQPVMLMFRAAMCFVSPLTAFVNQHLCKVIYDLSKMYDVSMSPELFSLVP